MVVPNRVTVTAAATRLDVATERDDVPQQGFEVTNGGVTILYLGGSTVTVLTGYPVPPGMTKAFDLFPGDAMYGIYDTGVSAVCPVIQVGV